MFVTDGDEDGHSIDDFFEDYNNFVNGYKGFFKISPATTNSSSDDFKEYYGYDDIHKWLSLVKDATIEELNNLGNLDVELRSGSIGRTYLAALLKESELDINNITTENYNAIHDALNRELAVIEKEMSDRVLNIRSAFQNMLYADADYWQIDDENVLSAINSLYASIDAEFIKQNELFSKSALQSFESNFISLFNNDDTRQAMVDFYTPMSDDETINKFTKRIKSALQDLMDKVLTDYEYVMENAQKSADDAANSADESHSSAILAESYAHGGTGTREGEDDDNARKYKELAESYAEDALNSKNVATQKAEEASNSAEAAKESENKSAEYEASTLQYKNDAEKARDNAKESEEKSLEYKNDAEISAQNSLDSANAAKQSEINSKNSEDKSFKFAESASNSADQAHQHEQNALQSEQNSKVSELNSAKSEINALQYAQDAEEYKNDASLSASSAKESKEASALSAEQAEQSALSASDNASKAESSSLEAESWAHGDTGFREGENINNSKYYSEQSKLCAEQAKIEAENAQKYAKVTAPDFFIDTDNMTLYIKVGMIIDFIVDENNVMYWSIL